MFPRDMTCAIPKPPLIHLIFCGEVHNCGFFLRPIHVPFHTRTTLNAYLTTDTDTNTNTISPCK